MVYIFIHIRKDLKDKVLSTAIKRR